MPSKMIEIECEYCGSMFLKTKSEIKRTKHHFCSKQCSSGFRAEKTDKAFMDRVKKLDSCWEWQGSTNVHGYGTLRYKKKHSLAHRVSYRIHKGDIPDGLHVCHRCDNPLCVNPDHLFLGTHQDNMDDMALKGRKHTKLTASDVVEIRKSDLSDKELSVKFDVSERTIRYAKDKTKWKLTTQPIPPAPKNQEGE